MQDVPGELTIAEPGDALALTNNYPIHRQALRTSDLSGNHFVEAVKIEYQGKKRIVFPFPDISVKAEGRFCLRYRMCHVRAQALGLEAIPVLAECYGDVFRIWSAREFPGLGRSTDLTRVSAGCSLWRTIRTILSEHRYHHPCRRESARDRPQAT
ncbi:hypothetical protein PUNSTDRAFT_61703 [Punctularia strigosozonata HHB-11173 SS5]|uniref:uncharacterized protein n=1 Tax=Punctularia strigosozonata (strain HHB-11173) TaxID=741275 RepID=UPI0004417A28|nr:uncharacterized protein PUNSTDRAFT_61703 [Punctularia strigosozonata HHB-11173 SS5]EIN12692.1 hypothetical protein PUNSTDRAFT_61703 [Punctularia strigosozonata HHB-11173 SS5]